MLLMIEAVSGAAAAHVLHDLPLFPQRRERGTIGLASSVVVTTIRDFGDDCYSAEPNSRHVYDEPGTYLVSCTITDDDGVSVTDWRYCEVPAEADVAGVAGPEFEEKYEESSRPRAGSKTIGVLIP